MNGLASCSVRSSEDPIREGEERGLNWIFSPKRGRGRKRREKGEKESGRENGKGSGRK
jgi:hypothetical protein